MLNLLYGLACFVGNRFPISLCHRMARVVARTRYLFFPRTRRAVQNNLAVVLSHRSRLTGEPAGAAEVWAASRRVYFNFARYMADFFTVHRWKPAEFERRIVFDQGVLREALSAGRGVVIVTAHLGNWELGGMAAAREGFRMHAIALPYKTRIIARIFREKRERLGVKVTFTGTSLKQILRALKNNESIAVLGDKAFTEHGIPVGFMGRTTKIPRGPASLAVHTGAKMIGGFLLMEEDGYRFVFEPVPDAPAGLGPDERITALTDNGAALIERYILRFPDQWLNFDPMWPPG